MPSSVVLLVTLLSATVTAAFAQQPPTSSNQRAALLHRSDRLVNGFQRSSVDETNPATIGTDPAAVGTDATAIGTDAAADRTDRTAADALSILQILPRVLDISNAAEKVRLSDTSLESQKEHVTSHNSSVTSPNQVTSRSDDEHDPLSSDRGLPASWTDISVDDIIDPRIVIISSNNTLLQEAYTALAVIGKIVLALLFLCVAVSVFFALGVIGNSSQVYNRYGHYDPYSPWGPYTANGAIDQPGYNGRALDTGEWGGGAAEHGGPGASTWRGVNAGEVNIER